MRKRNGNNKMQGKVYQTCWLSSFGAFTFTRSSQNWIVLNVHSTFGENRWHFENQRDKQKEITAYGFLEYVGKKSEWYLISCD